VVKPEQNLIDASGTAEALWRGWPSLSALPEIRTDQWRSAVVIAAHPDDEVLGTAGTLSVLAAAGCRLRIVAVTDGEASHSDSLLLDGMPPVPPRTGTRIWGSPPERALAVRRARERAAALRVLAANGADVVRLGLPDSGLAVHEADLVPLLRNLAGGFDACFAPWDNDAHPDHEAVGRAARKAGLTPFSYPIWMWHWALPGDIRVPWDRAQRLRLPPAVAAAKAAAIRCFGSQLEWRGPDTGPVLPEGVVAHFLRDQEVFFG
jgi:LmbE family N-acetylglucosaminyl deacetylase